jgi:UDP-N-acetylmuramoylalanine--D-glutamate ligase
MKIAIAGYGLEGKVNYQYWAQKYPDAELTIVDEQVLNATGLPEGAQVISGEGAFGRLNGFDLVVRTAGLSPRKIVTDGTIWTATNEFFEQCPAPIIGVTGTKGKGTTSTMITSILRAAGHTVHLVGNIGVPALEQLDSIAASDKVVYEMSSFQLWDITASPHIAVVLGIEPDHLNVHDGMEDYVAAKGGIVRYQKAGDTCIYHPNNQYAASISTLSNVSQKIRFAVKDDGGVYVEDGFFKVDEHIICSTDVLQVPGIHNIENACAAMTAARAAGMPYAALEQGMRDFEGLPHRIEFVRELNGVSYYNDSFSSAPAATVAAIRSFRDPEIVIVGGIDKGADFAELATSIRESGTVKEVVLIGEIKEKLAAYFAEQGVTAPLTVLEDRTMSDIVAYVRSIAKAGDVVLLSPGCASFDMFRDFHDRGDQFRTVVQAL